MTQYNVDEDGNVTVIGNGKKPLPKKITEGIKKAIKVFLTPSPSSPIFNEKKKKFEKIIEQEKLEKKFEKDKKLSVAKGGMINKYAKGGSVKKKNKMLTTKGWGASRKT